MPDSAFGSILLLDGVPELGALMKQHGTQLIHAEDADAAVRAMSERRPSAIVIDGDAAWQREWVSSLPAARRPPVLAVGGAPGLAAAVADEWLSRKHARTEVGARLELARERARIRAQMARRTFTDALTGLPNRRALLASIVREAARARRHTGPLSLVVLDLDDFKVVNETQGHPAGDRLLRRVGAALRPIIRGNELCGRMGGDEFAIILAGDLEDAERASRRAREALAEIGVSASGAACQLLERERVRELYRRTDDALKLAKERRRALIRSSYLTVSADHVASAERSF